MTNDFAHTLDDGQGEYRAKAGLPEQARQFEQAGQPEQASPECEFCAVFPDLPCTQHRTMVERMGRALADPRVGGRNDEPDSA